MPVLSTVILVLIAVISAIVGSAIVYFDASGRNKTKQILWTGITGIGFVFGILPGVVIISTYFFVSRKLQ